MDDYRDVEDKARAAGVTSAEFMRQSIARADENRRVHGVDVLRVHLQRIQEYVERHVPGDVTVSGITFDAETALPVLRAVIEQCAGFTFGG